MSYRVAAFYQFVALDAPAALRAPIREFCAGLALRGTMLLAPEGINGTLAGLPDAIDAFVAAMRDGTLAIPATGRLELKFSTAATLPFQRLKIRLKREIVTLGQSLADPARVGSYIEPQDWNNILADPEMLVIDTRNDFEVAMGSFAGAINPQTRRFGEFTDFAAQNLDPRRHPKIAMFCTGGIRCEKASAYPLAAGFAEVLHLKGGILNYLESVPASQSRWQGECFVFDERIALSHDSFGQDAA